MCSAEQNRPLCRTAGHTVARQRSDQRQAHTWFNRSVPLEVVETALLLAYLRRSRWIQPLNSCRLARGTWSNWEGRFDQGWSDIEIPSNLTKHREITDSDLYLRYVLGEVPIYQLHQLPERHVPCNAALAQYIVDPEFAPVSCDGAFAKPVPGWEVHAWASSSKAARTHRFTVSSPPSS